MPSDPELASVVDIDLRATLDRTHLVSPHVMHARLFLVPGILARLDDAAVRNRGFVVGPLTLARQECGRLDIVEGFTQFAVVRDMVHRAHLRGDHWWAQHVVKHVQFRVNTVDAADWKHRPPAKREQVTRRRKGAGRLMRRSVGSV